MFPNISITLIKLIFSEFTQKCFAIKNDFPINWNIMSSMKNYENFFNCLHNNDQFYKLQTNHW